MALSTPLDVKITDRGHNSISFSWTAGVDSTKTMIRYKENEYPSSETDGILGFHGKDTDCKITNLDINKQYYFRFWGTTDAYNLSAVTDTDLGMVPLGLAGDAKYLYVAGITGGAIRKYLKSDLSLAATIGGTAVTAERVCIKGRYMAFMNNDEAYLYDMSTETLILNFTATSDPGIDHLRAVHIDDEEEYVYYGNKDGTIYYYDIATLTQNIYKPHTDYVRSIDTQGDLLITGSNDDSALLHDRSTRTAPTLTATLAGITSTVEVTRFHGDYIYVGGDQSNGTVEIYNKATPYASVQSLGDTSSDITGICPKDGYLLVASDDTQAYLYTGTPGSLSLEQTFNEAGNDYVEDCWLDEDGTLYFAMGNSAEKLYSYTYLALTYSSTYNDIKGVTDVKLQTPRTPDENVIARHDFSATGYWKGGGVVLVGAEEVDDGLKLNGTGAYFIWENRGRLNSLTNITFKIKFTPNFAADLAAGVMFVNGGSNDLTIYKFTGEGKIRVTLGGTTIRDAAYSTWAPYFLENEENEWVLTGESSSTTLWLNGTAVFTSDASAWSNINPDTLIFGQDTIGGSIFKGTMHSFEIRNTLITNPED